MLILTGKRGKNSLSFNSNCYKSFEKILKRNIESLIFKNMSLEDDYKEMVTALKKEGSTVKEELTADQADALHMVVGISGEAGELLDAIKKYAIYQKTLDRENVVEELGDLEFYMEGLRQNLGILREETLVHNRHKLLTGDKARYKLAKYTNKQAQTRVDKQE